jgi:hypothetical protein
VQAGTRVRAVGGGRSFPALLSDAQGGSACLNWRGLAALSNIPFRAAGLSRTPTLRASQTATSRLSLRTLAGFEPTGTTPLARAWRGGPRSGQRRVGYSERSGIGAVRSPSVA